MFPSRRCFSELQKVSRKELTFSFDSGRERFSVTERWGSRFSAGLGILLLSALVAFLQDWERAWEGGCAGVSEALLPARCPVHPSPGAWALPLPSPAFPRSRRGPRRQAARRRAAPGPNGMNGDWTGEPRWRERPLGVALRTREGQAASSAQGSRREKFVAISLEVASAHVAVLGRKTERAPGQGGVGLLSLRFPVPSLTRYSLTCDSGFSSGRFADFSAFLTWRPAVGEEKVRGQLFRQLREWLYGLVART